MFSLEGLAVGFAICVHRSAEDCWSAAFDRAQHATLGNTWLDAFVVIVALFALPRFLAGWTSFGWHVSARQGYHFKAQHRKVLAELCAAFEIPQKNGGAVTLRHTRLGQSLPAIASRSTRMAEILKSAMARHGSLRVVFYSDGVTPGNVLAADNKRKSSLIHVSFQELGRWLHHGIAWVPFTVLRESRLRETPGGHSAWMRAIMLSLVPPRSTVFSLGVPIDLGEETCLLRLVPDTLLGDELALKSSSDAKGASGIKACLHCKNVVNTDKELTDPLFVHLWESDSKRFKKHSDADIYRIVDHLAAEKQGGATQTRMNDLQKYSGFNLNAEGWLCDHSLRQWFRPSQLHFDPMHIWWSNGLVGQELELFLARLDSNYKAGDVLVNSTTLRAFVGKKWLVPDSPHVQHSTPAARSSAVDLAVRDKCSASQLLMLYPLVGHFAREVVGSNPCMQRECDSLLAMCAVANKLQELKMSSSEASCAMLERLQAKHLQAYIAAYGK